MRSLFWCGTGSAGGSSGDRECRHGNPQAGGSTFDGRSTALALTSQRLLAALGLWDRLAPDAQPIRHIKVSDGRPGEPQTFSDQGAEAAWAGWNQARDRDLNAGR